MTGSIAAPATEAASVPQPPRDPEVVHAQRTAAAIFLVGALPITAFWVTNGKWVVALGQVLVAALIARAWYLGKIRWNKLFFAAGGLSLALGLVDVVRRWPDPAQTFSTISGILLLGSLSLLFTGRPTPRRRVTAILVYLLLGLPMAVAWLLTKLA